MSEGNKVIENINEKRKDYFGSKYSEHVFGQSGGSVTKLESEKENKDEFSEKQFWRDVDENDYSKKQTLSDKKKMIQREKLVSSGQILGDWRPKYFIRDLKRFLEVITPEELETLIMIKNNLFHEWKKASLIGFCTMTPFFYYFRSIITVRFFFITGIFFPILSGFFIGGYRNSKKAIVLMDKLGSEYTLSRIYKQTIFTKRRDLSDELKAEIYMKMNKENQKLEEEIKNREDSKYL